MTHRGPIQRLLNIIKQYRDIMRYYDKLLYAHFMRCQEMILSFYYCFVRRALCSMSCIITYSMVIRYSAMQNTIAMPNTKQSKQHNRLNPYHIQYHTTAFTYYCTSVLSVHPHIFTQRFNIKTSPFGSPLLTDFSDFATRTL